MSWARSFHVSLGVVALGLASGGQAAGIFLPVADAETETAAGSRGVPLASGGDRRVRIAHHQLATVRHDVEVAGEGRLLLNYVADGASLDVVVERAAATKWGYSLSGRVAGDGVGFVTLAVHEDVVAGSIWTPNASYDLLPLGDGIHALRDLTSQPTPRCGGIMRAWLDVPAGEGPSEGQDDGAVVDVLVIYTPAAEERAAAWTGSLSAARSWIEAFNDMAVASANDALRRSGAFVSLSLVGIERVDWSAATIEEDSGVLQSDDVQTLRNGLGADLVHATVGCCGGAALSSAVDGVGELSYLTVGSSSIFVAHEIGHNFGIGHERHEFVGTVGPQGYQHGFTTGLCELTIMSYGTECYGRGSFSGYFTRPPYYASPWRYGPDGRPLGVTRLSKERGARGPADAILTLNRNRHRVANFRPHH